MSRTTRTAAEDLRATLPAPAVPALSLADEGRLYRELRLRRADDERRHHRLQGAFGSGLLVASIVAVLALGVLSLRPHTVPATTPPSAQPAAAAALHRMSAAVFARSSSTVRDDQFVYVRSTSIENDGRFGGPVALGRPHEREIWLPQAPPRPGDHGGLIREYGQDWPIGATSRLIPASVRRPTYPWLRRLPTDPERLERELRAQMDVAEGQDPDQALFDTIGGLIAEGLVPPRQESALYDVVARIPGVTLDPHATDAVGRAGFGIGRTDERYGVRNVWVFRPGTPEILGTRYYFVGRGTNSAPVLFGATAVLERTVVDRQGERPGHLSQG